MKVIDIPIESIVIKYRKRAINNEKVKEIADSIDEIGLIQPITIDKKNVLIAGFHRYNAFKLLGKETIPAIIDDEENKLISELKEIDENLIRYNFHYTEEGDMLLDRKRIYEELHPETISVNIKGGPGRGHKTKTETAPVFVKDTSNKTNRSETVIKEEVRISKNIADDLKPKLRELEIPKTEALKLAKLDEDKQRQVIEKAVEIKRTGDTKVGNVIRKIELEEKEAEKEERFKESGYVESHIVNGDAIELLDKIENKSFDLLLTDPPYSTDIEDFKGFLEKWVVKAIDKIKDTGRIYIFAGSYVKEISAYINVLSGLTNGFKLSNILIWHYRNVIGPSPKLEYKRGWQGIFYLYGKNAPPLKSPLVKDLFDHFEISEPDGRHEIKFHSHQKPEELIKNLLVLSTERGDRVLDLFAGSGSIGLTSSKLERYSLSIEKEKDNIEKCIKRGLIGYEFP